MFKMHHTAISVSDFERSKSFYMKLGFKPYKYYEAEDKNRVIGMFKLGEMILEIFCFKEYKELPENAKSLTADLPELGVKHFALGVESIEDAKKFFEDEMHFSDIEINVGKLGKRYFFIKDPDGILVEVIEIDERYLRI